MVDIVLAHLAGSHCNDFIINASKYTHRMKTDHQARYFDDLLKEIEVKRAMKKTHGFKDQNSEEFKDELCKIVLDKGLCPPEYYDEICAKVIRPYSDVFWTEGCAAPTIKNYKAKIEFKPGHIIILGIIIMAVVMLLHVFGIEWFGIR